jgi:hypothetical protein
VSVMPRSCRDWAGASLVLLPFAAPSILKSISVVSRT